MINIGKGEAPIQINKGAWVHWCRNLDKSITLILFLCCPHCGDPQPDLQKEIDRESVALLRKG